MSGVILRTHERCSICDWLGHEAEHTATELGLDHWSSFDSMWDGRDHGASYLTEESPDA